MFTKKVKSFIVYESELVAETDKVSTNKRREIIVANMKK